MDGNTLLTSRLASALIRNPAEKTRTGGALGDDTLQALVNLGLVKFRVLARHPDFLRAPPGAAPGKPVPPHLFMSFSLFKPIGRRQATPLVKGRPAVLLGRADLGKLLDTGIPEFISPRRFDEGKRFAVITPSLRWSAFFAVEFERLGAKCKVYGSDLSAARQRKLIEDLREGKFLAVAGTPGLLPLLAWAGDVDALIFDADSEVYEAFPTSPDAFSVAVNALSERSALFIHHFAGAGAREIGVPPEIGAPGVRWHVLDISRWEGGGEHPLVRLAIEAVKFGEPLLILNNRLGVSSGFYCIYCESQADCPRCSGILHHSGESYSCSQCGFSSPKLECKACGGVALARSVPGIKHLARALEGVLGRKKVFAYYSEGEPAQEVSSAVTIATNIALYRPLAVKPVTVLIAGIEDVLRRHPLDGGERAAALLARVRGIYGEGAKTLLVATSEPSNPFLRWVSGGEPNYFESRRSLAKSSSLPPFAPRYIIRARGKDRKALSGFFDTLSSRIPGLDLSAPDLVRAASVTHIVFEAESLHPIDYAIRKKIVSIGRETKVEAIPYVVYF